MSDRLLEDERLDELLGLVFEPDPPDNGFTHRVMARIEMPSTSERVARGRFAGWRRFITRPIALAAAILLLMGVAYAAILTSSPSLPGVKLQEKERPRAGERSEPSNAKEETATTSSKAAQASPSPTMRYGSAEYGYSSSHTAYVVDQGLRLETETYVSEVKVGKAQRVTLTLENQTDQRIVVYGQKSCLLSVSVSKYQKEPSTSDSTSSTSSMVCANSDGHPEPYPSKSEAEYVTLEPHSKRVEHATITIPEAGEWAVIGHCNCFNRYKSSPGPSPSPSPRLSPDLPLSLRLGGIGRTPPPEEGNDGRFFTPPIRMVAR